MNENAMMLIVHSGSARSFAFEAIAEAKSGNIDKARDLLAECETEITQAHQIQTNLIQAEARGEETELSLLMVHAQDHLMTSLLMKDLCREFIDLYEKI
jgi:PTS system cellobiose-specific IIA component